MSSAGFKGGFKGGNRGGSGSGSGSATKSRHSGKSERPEKQEIRGLNFPAHFVRADENAYQQVKWTRRSSQISGSGGQVVSSMEGIEVPENWSQLATDIVASKYFRRAGVPKIGHENSVKMLVHRIAHTIRISGETQGGYFRTPADAEQFEKELVHLLVQQKGAFNSPVWFNCGLYHEYGIQGSGGAWAWNSDLNRTAQTYNSFAHPQCSACFIQSVEDDLMKIFDLVKNEARLFKFGSGTGTNFSKIRGSMEKLSGGGTSSGLMSFLEVFDRSAGATKSGGTTRRAAKMVCLDLDHPEIEDFINWKSREEKKVAALVASGYSSDFNGEAYRTVAGQNSNNSVRVPDEFMEAVKNDGDWSTTARTDGHVVKTMKARDLWRQIVEAAWTCADPGVQFDSIIQRWHTCPQTDRIYGSNPCSEYMFLDDSACNLASLNLLKFLGEDGHFDVEGYRYAARIFLTAQEILVDFSSYPTEQIAKNSHDYRPLGLGYANLGTLLMMKGIAYDSPDALAWTGALTAILTGEAYLTSSEIAEVKGPFAGYTKNAGAMNEVMRLHQEALSHVDGSRVAGDVVSAAQSLWASVCERGTRIGFRNAQATVLAPTGTIGLLMDCDTTGIEPDFALVKFKKLAGGGYFKIVNQSVPKVLKFLKYTEKQISQIVEYAVGTMSLETSPYINREALVKLGLNEVDLQKISSALPAAFDLTAAISTWVLGPEGLGRLGLTETDLEGKTLLAALGFNERQVQEASRVVCGRMTLEGAPYLRAEHQAIFDCANTCGPDGVRFIAPLAHVRTMAAAQPFLSGAISKTVNLPHDSTIEDVSEIYWESWKKGLKAVAIYRDGSKLSQPLSGFVTSSSSSSSGNSSPGRSKADREAAEEKLADTAGVFGQFTQKDLEEAIQRAVALAPARKQKMPPRRSGLTIEARVGGHKIYLRTGEYEDGRLGEIFIDMHKEGATLKSLLNCFAVSVSMGLQYGVPIEDYVDKFTFTRFEPAGLVDHPNIKQATSIIDYIFRVLGMEYLGKTDFVHVRPADEQLAVNRHIVTTERERLPNVRTDQMELPMEKAALPHSAVASRPASEAQESVREDAGSAALDPLNMQLSKMMGDAPMCSTCGHVTVRNGSCYRCLNCGNSMGCS